MLKTLNEGGTPLINDQSTRYSILKHTLRYALQLALFKNFEDSLDVKQYCERRVTRITLQIHIATSLHESFDVESKDKIVSRMK